MVLTLDNLKVIICTVIGIALVAFMLYKGNKALTTKGSDDSDKKSNEKTEQK